MRYSLLPLLLVLTLACKDAEKGKPGGTNEDAPVPSQQLNHTDDSLAIRKSIHEFYNWYNKNYTALMSFKLYKGIKKKDLPPYRIDWEQVTQYQTYIRNNIPWLGEEFLQDQQKFLRQCDSSFVQYPDDEMPSGFDYDWYTNSQEDPEYLLEQLNKDRPWPIIWKGEHAAVDIMGNYGNTTESVILELLMHKENGAWKIARIGKEEN